MNEKILVIDDDRELNSLLQPCYKNEVYYYLKQNPELVLKAESGYE